MTQNQIYTNFRRAERKIVRFITRKSVIHDFQELLSEIVKLLSFYVILGLHGAFRSVNPRITEKGLYVCAIEVWELLTNS